MTYSVPPPAWVRLRAVTCPFVVHEVPSLLALLASAVRGLDRVMNDARTSHFGTFGGMRRFLGHPISKS
jgi:hypothetical protein